MQLKLFPGPSFYFEIQTSDRPVWKNALWRFVAQFSELSAENLVRIYDSSTSSKPKIVDRTKLEKDKKRKLDVDKRMKKAETEAKRQKFKDRQSNKERYRDRDDRKHKDDRRDSNGKHGSRPAPY